MKEYKNLQASLETLFAINDEPTDEGRSTFADIIGGDVGEPTATALPEFYQSRLGKITASNFHKFIKKDKKTNTYLKSEGEVAKKEIYRIVWERMIDPSRIDTLRLETAGGYAITHGNVYEAEAISAYEQKTGQKVVHPGFIPLKENPNIGGTPDGLVGEHKIIEVKCPYNGANHAMALAGTLYNDDYMYQMQGYLWLTGRTSCDFVSYDPMQKQSHRLAIIEVQRDEKIILHLHIVLTEIEKDIQRIIEQLNSTYL